MDRKSEREKCYYRRNDSLWLITFAVRTGAWPPWTTGIKIFDGPVPRLSTVLSRAASNTKFQKLWDLKRSWVFAAASVSASSHLHLGRWRRRSVYCPASPLASEHDLLLCLVLMATHRPAGVAILGISIFEFLNCGQFTFSNGKETSLESLRLRKLLTFA